MKPSGPWPKTQVAISFPWYRRDQPAFALLRGNPHPRVSQPFCRSTVSLLFENLFLAVFFRAFEYGNFRTVFKNYKRKTVKKTG